MKMSDTTKMSDIKVIEASWSQHSKLLSAIRREVFIKEQKVPEILEWDGIDAQCQHVLAMDMTQDLLLGEAYNVVHFIYPDIDLEIDRTAEDEDAYKFVIGTGRLVNDGQIGRMAISKSYRRQGIGHKILQQLIILAEGSGQSSVYLHAQCYAVAFYQQAGFNVVGKTFMDAGIEHIKMVKQL